MKKALFLAIALALMSGAAFAHGPVFHRNVRVVHENFVVRLLP